MYKIICGALLFTCFSCSHRSAAEAEAREWASSMYPRRDHAVSCVGADTDGDGYVSCTVVVDGGDPKPLECAGRWTWNSGCRVPKAMLQGRLK